MRMDPQTMQIQKDDAIINRIQGVRPMQVPVEQDSYIQLKSKIFLKNKQFLGGPRGNPIPNPNGYEEEGQEPV